MNFDLALEKLLDPKGMKSPAPARKISDEFEDSLLGVACIPTQHFDFVCRVISDRSVLSRPGVEFLIMALFSNRDKLSNEQLAGFVGCIERNYGFVEDETLAFALCDFITRTLAPSKGLRAIKVLADTARSKAAIAGVLVGINILRREARASKSIELDAVESVAAVAQTRSKAIPPNDGNHAGGKN